MPTHIRLRHVGRNKQGSFRIVIAASEHAREGRITEEIGLYNPRREPPFIQVDGERALRWLRLGAIPSDTVVSLLKRAGVWQRWVQESRQRRRTTAGTRGEGRERKA